MPISKLFPSEFNGEMKKTRETLERVPEDKGDFGGRHDGILASRCSLLAVSAEKLIELPDHVDWIAREPRLGRDDRPTLLNALQSAIGRRGRDGAWEVARV
jgi:hypothetical protein